VKLSLLLSASCLFVSSLAHSQDAPVPSGGEHGCVALTRGLWVDVFEKRNAEAAHRYVDDTYIQHSPPPQPKGDKWIALWAGVYATPPTGPGKHFPEAQPGYTTQIVSIVGDEVLALLEARDTWTWGSGKHKGKRASSHYYDMFRCQGGKVVEHWYVPYQPPQ
jgi:predicted SnoaL-like aldol condensation-catalyzing enzyme